MSEAFNVENANKSKCFACCCECASRVCACLSSGPTGRSHREAGAYGSGVMSSSKPSESQKQNTGDDYQGLGNWGRGDALGVPRGLCHNTVEKPHHSKSHTENG